MMRDDPYRILGVPRGAEGEVIEKAYRRVARRVHPDVNPSPAAAAEFQSVQRAYEALRDLSRQRIWERHAAVADWWAVRRPVPGGRVEAPRSWAGVAQGVLVVANAVALAACVMEFVMAMQVPVTRDPAVAAVMRKGEVKALQGADPGWTAASLEGPLVEMPNRPWWRTGFKVDAADVER